MARWYLLLIALFPVAAGCQSEGGAGKATKPTTSKSAFTAKDEERLDFRKVRLAEKSQSTPFMVVSADYVAAAYRTDENKAKEVFVDKRFRLYGIVTSVSSNREEGGGRVKPYIFLKGNEDCRIICKFNLDDDEAAKLHVSAMVVIDGTGLGETQWGSPTFLNCRVRGTRYMTFQEASDDAALRLPVD
jgi:hypothetical protein